MNTLRFEDVVPDAALFLALVRGREVAPGIPDLAAAVRAAAARDMPRGALADALAARMTALGAPPEALASVERLRTAGTVAVVAGQQPVLFGGPHLVVSKALAAVALARRIEASGTPAVPLFWIASEDHDHAEVDHVHVPGPNGESERLSVELPGDRRMLSAVPLPAGVDAARARLGALLPEGPGRDAALAAADWTAGEPVGDAFARTMLRLLGRFGIAVVEPHVVRPFASAVARHEIEEPGDLAAAVTEAADGFAAKGFARPLELRRPELIFLVENHARIVLTRISGGFVVGDQAHTESSLLQRLEGDPAAFSWNVAARVLAQDMALPVAAQICGPSELSYAAVLGPAHARLGIPAPALVARPGVTFVASRTAARCAELATTPAAFVRDGLHLAAGPRAGEPEEVEQIRRIAGALPEGSGPAAKRRRAGFLRDLDLYAEAIRRERDEQASVHDRRRLQILAELRPHGVLQEREISILPFIARHGEAMLDEVLAAFGDPGTEHAVLVPGES